MPHSDTHRGLSIIPRRKPGGVGATRPVDACDEGILLIGFAYMDVRSVHTRILAPLFECPTQKRGAIVRPNALSQTMLTRAVRKDTHQPR